ncbi:hypothetical protein [Nocardia goodfellowii]|uniref:Secreted protein n=1 Tax=Nocardia goodfellowii TaxID=882446 RepID=A0ABS4QMS8_9NOCA|nr:hypothetical protein [Nocardia goodfellowii]MBP2192398.1 hypothetical protein [Nocardia goodfellowii]
MGKTRSVLGVSLLIAGAATMTVVAAAPAGAEPRDCTLHRSPTGAAAHCGGDGTYILEVDCVGVNLAGGPIVGTYNKSVTGFADPTPGRELYTHPGRDCMMPVTLGQIGFALDARITPFPTRPGLPSNAYEYDPGR